MRPTEQQRLHDSSWSTGGDLQLLQSNAVAMPPLKWVLHPSNVCSHRGCCSTQQLEQLEGQRAAGQQELLRAREELSRAQLEAEVARGEQAALGEALAQVCTP